MATIAHVDGDDTSLESLEPIRSSIRALVVNEQFTWEQSWKSVLADVNQARRGLLLPDVFQQTLELSNIRLTKRALEAVITQFQLANGAVQAHKFLTWINLSKPNDYVDPELVFVRLPQPYRRIVKVLECDILDRAWEMITLTSAKYKAETTAAAALSARSARSSMLNLHNSPDPSSSPLEDDYSAAKKRCNKVYTTLALRGRGDVLALREHRELPVVVVVLGGSSDSSQGRGSIHLELVHVDQQGVVQDVQVPLPVDDVENMTITHDVASVTSLCTRRDSIVSIALHIVTTRTPLPVDPEGEQAAPSSHSVVVVYDFDITGESAPRLVAMSTIQDPNDQITAIGLAYDASRVAVATSKRETHIFSLTSESTDASPQLDLLASPALAVIPTDAPVSSLFFLHAPATHGASISLVPTIYAIALVAHATLLKYVLPDSSSSTTPTPGRLLQSWRHLAPISSSSIDPTTQFVILGGQDGSTVVWNLVDDRDHAILTPPLAPRSGPIDTALLYHEHFLVTLSTTSQQVCFYDLSDRAVPLLLRTVTPPPPTQTLGQAAPPPPTLLTSLSLNTASLDVPLIVVGYSSGYAMLYDLRAGDAVGSVRTLKQERQVGSVLCCPTNAGVIAVVREEADSSGSCSLHWHEWSRLLVTMFPTLPQLIAAQQLEQTTTNLKRLFLASVEYAPPSLSISLGSKPNIESLLHASVGRAHRQVTHQPAQTLADLKPIGVLPASSSSSASSSTSSLSLVSSLAPLPEVTVIPSRPNFTTHFLREYASRATHQTERDSKLHRRRNELLKILTAAW